jgi:hypothetical protein
MKTPVNEAIVTEHEIVNVSIFLLHHVAEARVTRVFAFVPIFWTGIQWRLSG